MAGPYILQLYCYSQHREGDASFVNSQKALHPFPHYHSIIHKAMSQFAAVLYIVRKLTRELIVTKYVILATTTNGVPQPTQQPPNHSPH